MSGVFLTGFPGFLGSELLPRLLRASEGTATCLVQPACLEPARQRLEHLELTEPALRGRVRLLEGDITKPDLGLGAARRRIASGVSSIFHLAAAYDLGVRREVGMRVNLYGTRHVLDFAAACEDLERFHYVSTCFVSGRHPGIFHEHDLERGQAFSNWYEETKHLAERAVRERMQEGLRATIYRPSIVVGDSRTGATRKYDGPYGMIRWMLRRRRTVPIPGIKGADSSRLNVVPADFVIGAIDLLSALPHSVGRTYQLADPDPLTVDETIDLLAEATGRTVARVPISKGVARALIGGVPGVARWTGIQPESLDYFDHPTHYSVQNTLTDLHGSGVSVPPLASYAGKLVEFVRAHPEIGSGGPG